MALCSHENVVKNILLQVITTSLMVLAATKAATVKVKLKVKGHHIHMTSTTLAAEQQDLTNMGHTPATLQGLLITGSTVLLATTKLQLLNHRAVALTIMGN